MKRKTVVAFGYNVAADALVLAYALKKDGKDNQAKEVLASLLDSDGIEQLVLALDNVNQKAIAKAHKEIAADEELEVETPEEIEDKDGIDIDEIIASLRDAPENIIEDDDDEASVEEIDETASDEAWDEHEFEDNDDIDDNDEEAGDDAGSMHNEDFDHEDDDLSEAEVIDDDYETPDEMGELKASRIRSLSRAIENKLCLMEKIKP